MDKNAAVPTWDGCPSTFESYVTAAKWYERGIKSSERQLVVARLWGHLTGAAKSVVRYLEPEQFEGDDGLARFIDILRQSPLQSLPVPDSFTRLEKWHNLRRSDRESVTELIVREEELFTELQQSLVRARKDRGGATVSVSVGSTPTGRLDPAMTPSMSPIAAHRGVAPRDALRETLPVPPREAQQQTLYPALPAASPSNDFFEDELRGYRLLRASRLSNQEKQNVLVQTSNSTSFVLIRRALRTLYAEDSERPHGNRSAGKIWYGNWDESVVDDSVSNSWWSEWDEWGEWSPNAQTYWQDGDDDWWWQDWDESEEFEEVLPDEKSTDPEEVQLVEAFNIASEAGRTLKDAREAVRRTRLARGYYAPESNSGKGIVPSSSPSSSSRSAGKGNAKSHGPCFICGMPGHGYLVCPDRFAKGNAMKGSKGKSKGKFRSYGKGKTYFVDLTCILSAHWDADAVHGRAPTRAVIDTGASENAIGIDSLHDLVTTGRFQYGVELEDLPTFRFGNGHRDQAVSRVDLLDTSLGSLSFYVLGGMAKQTPPLIGARTLRGKKATLSYHDGVFRYNEPNCESQRAIQMQALTSGHVTIDLSEVPQTADGFYATIPTEAGEDKDGESAESATCHDGLAGVSMINMVSVVHDACHGDGCNECHDCNVCHGSCLDHSSCECHGDQQQPNDLSSRLQCLASRLQRFREGSPVGNGRERGDGSWGHSSGELSMLRKTQDWQVKDQSVRNLEHMCSLRPPNELCLEGCGSWSNPPVSSGPQPSSADHRGVAEGSECFRLHGGHREWQDDGAQGEDDASRIDGANVNASELCPVPGTDGESHESGLCIGISDSGLSKDSGKSSSINTSDNGPSAGSCEDAAGRGECRVEKPLGEGREDSIRGHAPHRDPGSRSHEAEANVRTEEADSRGCGRSGSNQPRELAECGIQRRGEEEEASRVSEASKPEGAVFSLWDRLKSLRSRMAPFSGQTAQSTTISAGQESVRGSRSFENNSSQPISMADNPLKKVQTGSTSLSRPVPDGRDFNSKRAVDHTNSKKNLVMPNLAAKIATSVAVLGASIALPVQGLMAQIADTPDFVEVACAPTSSLTTKMEEMGYMCKRINYKSGYDLSVPAGTTMLKNEFKLHPPRFSWVSLPCTRLTSLQNLTERTELEWCQFEKRVGRDLKRADEVADAVCSGLDARPEMDFGWEWPTSAARGWRSKAIQRLLTKMEKLRRPVFWCRFHGCAYGLEHQGIPVLKGWTVWMSLQKKCPGHGEHAQCRGVAAQASAYYPAQMVSAVTKAISNGWIEADTKVGKTLTSDIETFLLDVPVEAYGDFPEEIFVKDEKVMEEVRLAEPELFALSRTSYPKEPPTGRKLELIKQQMLRIHRASGHSSFGNLQRLLRARKAPSWAVELAGKLQCPACIESRKPLLHPPASTNQDPVLFEVVGTDIFEFEHGDMKHKLVIWRDRASGYTISDHLHEYKGHWEPSSKDIINSFTKWLMVNPSPSWILSDSGVQYTSEEFQNFCLNSGIGHMTAPAEAHWILGAEEGTIGILKSSVTRLLREEPDLTVANAFALASHGANHTIGPSGFSAFQWVRGGATPQDPLLSGLDPRKAFGGVLRLKEKARIAFEQEHAKAKLSKLNNALGRSPTSFRPGQLAMIWRQRMKPGKTSGHWQGPVRVLLQEGSTLWLGSGSSLIRAKTNQCRDCTKREELQATLDGVAVIQQPVTLETLLKSFTGRHYTNITGEVPSATQMSDELSPTDVRVPPDRSKQRPDERRGLRAPGPKPPKVPKVKPTIQKKKGKETTSPATTQDVKAVEPVPDGRIMPGTPRPMTPRPLDSTGAGSNQCSVQQCNLPGGHAGPHKDESGKPFSWTSEDGRVDLEGDQSDSDSSTSSSSSTSSEELRPDVDMRQARSHKRKAPEASGFYALEIEVDESTAQYLRAHPRKAAIWLSKKMQEKGKEHHWQHLSIEEKQNFDLAQAKELSQVIQSKALRSLTSQELHDLDARKCMKMRWVLTTKSDGTAKTRLVILGFQQHNLTEVQAAAPTMNRMSKNILLMTCANMGLAIRSGDVSSAFLQTSKSMEQEELTVWATPELAVLFGAPPENPWLPLRVSKAFYGLCHAPRAWYEDVAATLQRGSWKKMISDGCLFTLHDGPTLVGIAGIHVDDFLIGGREGNPVFEKAMKELESAYRWGKWQHKEFTFAGSRIRQESDFSIYVDQNDYSEKYMDEVEISAERAQQPKALATTSEISQLRGLIGSMAWRSSQTSPQFQADIGLLLSEIPYATVDTLVRANKLVREMKRTPQSLLFPHWGVPWDQLAIVVWADASNSNRPDRSSTMGIVAGCAPVGILSGEKHAVALIQWRSSKTPRQCLGSNGAEVQSITEGEDLCFRLRALLAEVNGESLTRQNLTEVVREKTSGALIMDSKGIYDSMTRNVSALHGLKSGRAGYELTIAVSQALDIQTMLRWVNGETQLADALTKGGAARKMMMQFFAGGQKWQLVHDPDFVAGKKVKKRALEEKLKEMQSLFVAAVQKAAEMYRWPFHASNDPAELRMLGDEISSMTWKQLYPDNPDM